MNWNDVEGKWMQFKFAVQKRWSLLTGDDLNRIGGSHDRLVAKMQERYGMTRQQAERELDEFWATTLGCSRHAR